MKQQAKAPEAQCDYSIKSMPTDEAGFVFDVGSAYAYFEQIKDKRKARGRQYALAAVLTLCVLGKLGGQNTPAGIADWVKHRADWLCEALGMKRRMTKRGQVKMPCAGSYSRILSTALDAQALEKISSAFFASQSASASASVSARMVELCIDGKKVRGTITPDKPNGEYLLAAYAPGVGVVLMQMLITPGEGELTVAPTVLKALNLQGKVITGDALFAQRNLSLQIVQAGGDYVWKVKGNQPALEASIASVFAPDSPASPGFSNPKKDLLSVRDVTAGHGRIEERVLTTSSLLTDYNDWPGLQQVFKYDCVVTDKHTGQRTATTCYGITSLTAAQANPKRLLRIVRGHWRIENGLHYRRDVLLHEDRCGLRLPQLVHVFAILNNWVLGLFALSGGGNFAAAQRRFNAHPEHALELVLRA